MRAPSGVHAVHKIHAVIEAVIGIRYIAVLSMQFYVFTLDVVFCLSFDLLGGVIGPAGITGICLAATPDIDPIRNISP